MAEAVFADPELRERFEIMAKGSNEREPVRDDFAWLPLEAAPSPEFSRFKSLAQKLFGVSKANAHRD